MQSMQPIEELEVVEEEEEGVSPADERMSGIPQDLMESPTTKKQQAQFAQRRSRGPSAGSGHSDTSGVAKEEEKATKPVYAKKDDIKECIDNLQQIKLEFEELIKDVESEQSVVELAGKQLDSLQKGRVSEPVEGISAALCPADKGNEVKHMVEFREEKSTAKPRRALKRRFVATDGNGQNAQK